MNKAELIAKIADDAGVNKTQANAAVDSFVEAVTKTLKGGGKVTLVGFGTFSVSKRSARNGRNPQTGAVIKIKAKKVDVKGYLVDEMSTGATRIESISHGEESYVSNKLISIEAEICSSPNIEAVVCSSPLNI